jgi:hypothetical protein
VARLYAAKSAGDKAMGLTITYCLLVICILGHEMRKIAVK